MVFRDFIAVDRSARSRSFNVAMVPRLKLPD
jgi:hypothetical protein